MNNKFVIAVTGGGSGVFERLLSMGGASSWFLEGIIPYNQKALDEFLGRPPEKYCSSLTARRMAMKAFQRAIKLGAMPDEAVGIGCTASLALKYGEEERDGRKHHYYIAKQDHNHTLCYSFLFNPVWMRDAEEHFVSQNIQKVVHGKPITASKYESAFDNYDVGSLILDGRGYKVVDGVVTRVGPIIYPGSFNPFHKGHKDVVDWSNKYLGAKPYLEISITNIDKGCLDYVDVESRINSIRQFEPDISGVFLTNAPLFFNKSCLFCRPSFILGCDTFNRMLEWTYYKSVKDFEEFVDHCKANNTHFFVLDRKGHRPYNNVVERFEMQKLITFVSKSQYQDIDGISSREIRSKWSQNL